MRCNHKCSISLFWDVFWPFEYLNLAYLWPCCLWKVSLPHQTTVGFLYFKGCDFSPLLELNILQMYWQLCLLSNYSHFEFHYHLAPLIWKLVRVLFENFFLVEQKTFLMVSISVKVRWWCQRTGKITILSNN